MKMFGKTGKAITASFFAAVISLCGTGAGSAIAGGPTTHVGDMVFRDTILYRDINPDLEIFDCVKYSPVMSKGLYVQQLDPKCDNRLGKPFTLPGGEASLKQIGSCSAQMFQVVGVMSPQDAREFVLTYAKLTPSDLNSIVVYKATTGKYKDRFLVIDRKAEYKVKNTALTHITITRGNFWDPRVSAALKVGTVGEIDGKDTQHMQNAPGVGAQVIELGKGVLDAGSNLGAAKIIARGYKAAAAATSGGGGSGPVIVDVNNTTDIDIKDTVTVGGGHQLHPGRKNPGCTTNLKF
ncbi:MAG: hypothetical protein PHY92_08325 [Alphaproteobacteria bacterium]|nr:hypothetical protein [Alphaproteobacteria bacterium]